MKQIRSITENDLPACAALLIDAYNREPWHNHWTMDTAMRYLSEFLRAERFKGFLMEQDGRAVGAAFCHSRTWWTGDELYVDEFYIASDMQRKGLGGELMAALEAYVQEQGWNGITLLTNRHFPARDFYQKHGFSEAEHVVFMYKVLKKP
jgi:aminoglycoside 6'-N-acetyltransferase I